MTDEYHRHFGPFEGKIWLNCASEGPLSDVAVKETQEALDWKTKPYHLTRERFKEVPRRLKTAIGTLINVPPDDVILGNSATYGLHLLANGIPFQKGDEILLMKNDFPTSITPWLGLQRRGISVRQLSPKSHVLTPGEFEAAITPKTKLLCLSHVHTFSGHTIDVAKFSDICRKRGILFILNCAQSIGATPVDVPALQVDAITCAGYKWLLGPYGTGFCWIHPKLRDTLDYNQAYWYAVLTAEDLQSDKELTLSASHATSRYDVFCTANFFNFKPLAASIEYLLKIGIETIKQHNDRLIDRFISALDGGRYDLISPRNGRGRSGLVVISNKQNVKNPKIFRTLQEQGIYLALWKNNLRLSPHLYNTESEIDRLLAGLHSA